MAVDFNELEIAAERHIADGSYAKALAIFYFMADGDPSLDAGRLAERIASCYRALGDPAAAKYWYGRATEENPEIYGECVQLIEPWEQVLATKT